MKRYSYTNKHGSVYYPHCVRGGDGRSSFVMRGSAKGAIRALPKGWEVRESVNGRVAVRWIRPKRFLPLEEQLLRAAMENLRPFAHVLDIDGRAATIYASAEDRKCFLESLDAEFADGFADALTKTLSKRYSRELVALFRAKRKEQDAKRPRYYPLLRFVLVDKRTRRFAVERVCFTGESSWIQLEVMPLSAAVLKYLPHLGRDSLFDLI